MNPLISAVALGISCLTAGNTIIGTVRKKLYPHPISWTLWLIIAVISWFAAYSEQLSSTLIYESFMVPALSIIVYLAWKNTREKDIRPTDIISAVMCVVAVIAWQISDNAVLAIGFAVVADFFALIPSLRHIFIAPHEESWLSYGLSGVRNALFLANAINAGDAMMPLYVTIMDSATAALIIVLRLWKSHQQQVGNMGARK